MGATGIASIAAGCLSDDDGADANGDANGDENGDTNGGENGDENGGENGDENGDDPEGPYFDVGGLDPSDLTVPEGESVDVSATVTNTGEEADEQDVEFRIDGEVLGSETLSLEPGDEEGVSFEGVEIGDFGPSEYTYGVYSDDDSATGTLTVQQELDPDEWADVDTIRLLGNTSGWIGAEPEMIDGIQNPSILLFEGQEYELTWENDDGGNHNIAIWDENSEVVDDLATQPESGSDVVQTLEFEATDEMVRFVCEPHSGLMRGDIVIE